MKFKSLICISNHSSLTFLRHTHLWISTFFTRYWVSLSGLVPPPFSDLLTLDHQELNLWSASVHLMFSHSPIALRISTLKIPNFSPLSLYVICTVVFQISMSRTHMISQLFSLTYNILHLSSFQFFKSFLLFVYIPHLKHQKILLTQGSNNCSSPVLLTTLDQATITIIWDSVNSLLI